MHDEAQRPITRRGFVGLAAGASAGVALGLPAAARAAVSRPDDYWPITEPYPPLNGGMFSGPAVPESKDPLVRYRWLNPTEGDGLQVYQLHPMAAEADTPASFGNLQSLTTARCNVLVTGPGSIRCDFGVESPAWLEFDSPDFSGSVEMSISEYNDLERVNPGPEHPIKTFTPQRYGNTFRLELNADFFEGVRFGWIHVRTFDRPWHITAVRAVCQAKPTNYNGTFACSDATLTRIWYAGAYSARAGFQKDYMAPILIDRGDRFGWAGDCNPIQAAALVAFGNWDFIRHNLDRTVDSTFGIETYSLYWILSLLEYYRHTGDTAMLENYTSNVQAKLDHGNSIYRDPPILFYGWDERLGAGFEAANRPETKSAYRMLFIRACREYAGAMDGAGHPDISARYRNIADQRVAELRADPRWFEPLGVHALAEAINAGCVAPGEQQTIFEQEFADRLNRLSFSTFNQYFILQAMAAIGRYDEALVTVRDNWGGQLSYGGTTYFEVFRPDWLRFLAGNDPVPNSQSGWTSLAHPWGGGVSAWLSHDVLGIRPTSPGFATVDIWPQLGTTLSWVSGSVPTPRGPVSAQLDVESGDGKVTIPPGAVARVGIPAAGRRINRILVNGQLAWDGQYHHVAGIGGATEVAGDVLLTDAQPGSYELEFGYQGAPAAFRAEPIRYPMRFLFEDKTTSGDWGGVYGRDGYVLFNYDGPGKHRSAPPSYIVSVVPWENGYAGWSNCLNTAWVNGTSDRRALAPDRANGVPRNAACVYSATPSPGGMTMAIDVTAAPGASFQLAMYFVDWDSVTRRSAVEVFDLETRKLVAPEQMVTEFNGGKYLVYRCDRSVRLRIAHIRGDNAVLSGLFFDPAHPA